MKTSKKDKARLADIVDSKLRMTPEARLEAELGYATSQGICDKCAALVRDTLDNRGKQGHAEGYSVCEDRFRRWLRFRAAVAKRTSGSGDIEQLAEDYASGLCWEELDELDGN